jgi:hypothetical protein
MRSLGAMVNSVWSTHTRYPFVPDVFRHSSTCWTDGWFDWLRKFVCCILYVTSSVQRFERNSGLETHEVHFRSYAYIIIFMCITLAESLYTIIWKTVVSCVHIQAHSHQTAEFASLGPLQLDYAVFMASRKSPVLFCIWDYVPLSKWISQKTAIFCIVVWVPK